MAAGTLGEAGPTEGIFRHRVEAPAIRLDEGGLVHLVHAQWLEVGTGFTQAFEAPGLKLHLALALLPRLLWLVADGDAGIALPGNMSAAARRVHWSFFAQSLREAHHVYAEGQLGLELSVVPHLTLFAVVETVRLWVRDGAVPSAMIAHRTNLLLARAAMGGATSGRVGLALEL
jgi:hypothetical protein